MDLERPYRDAGVDYEPLDAFKRLAQQTAQPTAFHLARFGFGEIAESRGESAYLIETPWGFIAHVDEGLGTKNVVADDVYALAGKSFANRFAQDTVASIVNDLAAVGAAPVSMTMHLAAGDGAWFRDAARIADLVRGWRDACTLARCAWGGGETAILKDIVIPGRIVLAGSGIGIVRPKERLLAGSRIEVGDAIVLIGSTGVHANGLTLARSLAAKLPRGYATPLADGRTYGEALLDPSRIYAPLVEDCQEAGIELHYGVHLTGHGWRKLMRAVRPFTYRIERVPEPQPVFRLIQETARFDDATMYATFNMGAGFALMAPEQEVERIAEVARHLAMSALHAGTVEGGKGERVVRILPKGIVFDASSLCLRA